MNAIARALKRWRYLRLARQADKANNPVMAGVCRELAQGLKSGKPKTHNEASPISSTRPRR